MDMVIMSLMTPSRRPCHSQTPCRSCCTLGSLGVVATGDEALSTEVLHYLRGLLVFLLVLLHLRLRDEEGPTAGTHTSLLLPRRFADCDPVAAAAPPIWGRHRVLLLHLALGHGVRGDTVRGWR